MFSTITIVLCIFAYFWKKIKKVNKSTLLHCRVDSFVSLLRLLPAAVELFHDVHFNHLKTEKHNRVTKVTTLLHLYSHLFVERGTFSMKGLLPFQERWCETQNRQCKHVGNPFIPLSVPLSIRESRPASISQLTNRF